MLSEIAGVPGLVLVVITLTGTLAAVVVVVFGTRSRVLSDQQAKAIDAMDARLDAVEAENESLRREAVLKDALVESLKAKVEALQEVVTSKRAIEHLADQLDKSHERILQAIKETHPVSA